MTNTVQILTGDVLAMLATLPDGCVQCCCTSPPYYGLRDYGTARWDGGDPACDHFKLNGGTASQNLGKSAAASAANVERSSVAYRDTCGKCGAVRIDSQIGLEPTPEAFIEKMVAVFSEVKRVLRDDGTLWLNLGDSYAQAEIRNRNGESEEFHRPCRDGVAQTGRKVNHGLKPKDLCMMPWRVALALQADGWYLRSVIVWAKKSPMPESVRDRPTSSWEPIFLMSKNERYYYDAEAVREPNQTPQGSAPSTADMAKGTYHNRDNTESGHGYVYNRGACINPSGRNQRNVWHLGPEPRSECHFATFPSEIPRRAILAGTSEKGCCPVCGAGWERAVERSGGTIGKGDWRQGAPTDRGMCGVGTMPSDTNPGVNFDTYRVRTIGWKPGCECKREVVEYDDGDMRRTAFLPHEPIPCTVLDPFLGSGTTLAVARQLGRRGIGIELNPEYVKLAEDRIGRAEKPHTYASPGVKDSPLFAGVTQ